MTIDAAGLSLLIWSLGSVGDAAAQANRAKDVEVTYAPSGIMVAKSEYTQLKFQCEGSPPFRTITCRFFQFSLREAEPRLSERDEQDLAKLRASSPNERTKILAQYRALCATVEAGFSKAAEAELGDQPPGRLKVLRDSAAQMREVCTCGDNLECWFRRLFRLEHSSCKLTGLDLNPITFERTAKRTWVSRSQAGMSCPSVTNVIVLEHEKTSTTLWTMTQTRVGTIAPEDQLCGVELNQPAVYSWRYSDDFSVSCPSFKFGF